MSAKDWALKEHLDRLPTPPPTANSRFVDSPIEFIILREKWIISHSISPDKCSLTSELKDKSERWSS